MKMPYLHKLKKENTLSRKIIKILAFGVLLIFINFLTGGFLKETALKFVGLIWQKENQAIIFTDQTKDVLKSKPELIAEINQLKISLENERASFHLKNLYLENKYNELKDLVNLTPKEDSLNFSSALVIAKPPQTGPDIIAIDINPEKLKDLNRIYSENFIIGVFEKTDNWPILVNLYGKINEEIRFLIGNDKIPESGVGLGGGAFEIFVPKDLEIAQGEPVYVNNGFADLYGYISNVSLASEGDAKSIIVRSPINLNELSSVILK